MSLPAYTSAITTTVPSMLAVEIVTKLRHYLPLNDQWFIKLINIMPSDDFLPAGNRAILWLYICSM